MNASVANTESEHVTLATLLEHVLQRLEAQPAPRASEPMPAYPALDGLRRAFGLTAFETEVLALCAANELDARVASLCAKLNNDPTKPYPSFGLALAALPDPHWSAVSPSRALRSWKLLELGSAHAMTLAPLRIDERILNHMLGLTQLDERLRPYLEKIQSAELVPSHQDVAQRGLHIWQTAPAQTVLPVVTLTGLDAQNLRSIAASVAINVQRQAFALRAETLPIHPNELEHLIRILEREHILSGLILVLECETLEPTGALTASVNRFIERVNLPLIVTSPERRNPQHRAGVTLEVGKPAPHEQRQIWRDALEGSNPETDFEPIIEQLTSHFRLNPSTIRTASRETLTNPNPDQTFARALWQSCRTHARVRLDDLAQRIEARATWDDLILPEAQKTILQDIVTHVQHRHTVYETWGFASSHTRGLGIAALFAGSSGTGKTMAAEVIAGTLELDLYRIDLSTIISKYIGETEKNLRRIFDAAETGGAILLFDEADALFGKRSEVKDSHDRYANIEVSYLLQSMESYSGLAVLTTNLKSAIDTAFLRRIRFITQFPFPDAELRAAIWKRAFPSATPTENLEPEKLAQLNVAGGNIRSIALNAAFIAASARSPVQMGHVLQAARGEYAKLEKQLTASEIEGWE
jgi:ATPase family associated with various cellular activities (AAA)